MTTGGHANRLAGLSRDLRERWQQTRESWNDAKAREFEETYLRELDTAVNAALTGLQHLEGTLRKIRHDCE